MSVATAPQFEAEPNVPWTSTTGYGWAGLGRQGVSAAALAADSAASTAPAEPGEGAAADAPVGAAAVRPMARPATRTSRRTRANRVGPMTLSPHVDRYRRVPSNPSWVERGGCQLSGRLLTCDVRGRRCMGPPARLRHGDLRQLLDGPVDARLRQLQVLQAAGQERVVGRHVEVAVAAEPEQDHPPVAGLAGRGGLLGHRPQGVRRLRRGQEPLGAREADRLL